jgi:phage baseplate assembly protein W
MATYTGFSTYNRLRKFTLTDFELVKQDIFNHFSIKKGEKLMNPKFGTAIWDTLFEPFTDEIREIIASDIKTVVDYDPRVDATDIRVTEYEHGILIELDLRYVLTNQVDAMSIRFNRESETFTIS